MGNNMDKKNHTNHIKKVKPAKAGEKALAQNSIKASKAVGLGCIPSGLPPDLVGK